MLFELRNDDADRVSHCGVLEFIAEEGMIYMPYWVCFHVASLVLECWYLDHALLVFPQGMLLLIIYLLIICLR